MGVCPNGEAIIELMRNQLWLAEHRQIPVTEIRLSPVAYRRLKDEAAEETRYAWRPEIQNASDRFYGHPVRMCEQQTKHVRVMCEGDE